MQKRILSEDFLEKKPWYKKLLLYFIQRFFQPKTLILVPYFWLILFFLLPGLIVFNVSLSESIIGSPPYKSIYEWVGNYILEVRLNLSNYIYLLEDRLYVQAFFNSLMIAFLATVVALIIGFPLAYGISRVRQHLQPLLIMLLMVPFFTSMLIRIYAWIAMLSDHGLLNLLLLKLGLIDAPLPLLGNQFSVCIGIVYSYLPFMVLPLYSVLQKVDADILEAASDLGCRPFKRFFTIILPLSLKAIGAGSILVFIPAVGEFAIPELLGGNKAFTVGRVLWAEFFINRDWPMASSLAIFMIFLLVVPAMFFQQRQYPAIKDKRVP